jgi:hypothetical protein
MKGLDLGTLERRLPSAEDAKGHETAAEGAKGHEAGEAPSPSAHATQRRGSRFTIVPATAARDGGARGAAAPSSSASPPSPPLTARKGGGEAAGGEAAGGEAARAPPPLSSSLTPSSSPEPHCIICYSSGVALRCTEECAHGLCASCFVSYAEELVAQDAGLVRQRRGLLLCPMRSAELGGCVGSFREQAIAALLPECVYDRYASAVREQIRHEEFTCAMQSLQEQVKEMAARLRQGVPGLSRQALARQLREALPGARQCARCGFGPIDHFRCADLAAHHGQNVRGGAQVRNSCPDCGWFTRDVKDWPMWDGRFRDGVADGELIVLTPATVDDEEGRRREAAEREIYEQVDADRLLAQRLQRELNRRGGVS